MTDTVFHNAERIQTSLLAKVEKQSLIWIAHRLPRWVTSDHLTALGFLSILAAGLAYWWARWRPEALVVVIGLLALNWFGDSLDGTLARVRDRQRPRYGFYVDHVLDAIGTTGLVIGIGLSGYMSPIVALGVLVSYLLLSIEVYLATYSLGLFRMSFWKFGPTELRLALSLGNLTLLVHPCATIMGESYRLFDIAGIVAIAGLTVTMLGSAAANARALSRAEPLPPHQPRSIPLRDAR